MTYKSWQNYEEQKLVDIYSGEDWDNFFEFQCALEAIPFLPTHPGAEPDKFTETKDLTTWKIKDIRFKNKADADKIYSLIATMPLCTTDYHQGVYVVKEIDSDNYNYPKLTPETHYSPELYQQIKQDLSDFEDRKAAWKKLKSAYDEVADLRADLSAEIQEVIQKQVKKNSNYICMVDKHKKYLELANDDNKIALNFLSSACPNYKDEFPEYFNLDEKVIEG